MSRTVGRPKRYPSYHKVVGEGMGNKLILNYQKSKGRSKLGGLKVVQ